MAIEITVILKDEERTYKQKFLHYENLTMDVQDPFIQSCIKSSCDNFKGDPEDIVIKTTMVIK
jgi:hypothetical protein